MGYSMRTAHYRLTLWVDRATREKTEVVGLYDFEKDPRGGINRVRDPEYREAVERLTAQLKSIWQAEKSTDCP